ncbi:MAG: molecular chaperone GrpE [Gammaproteobacteria bacterium]|jgi:molecular chaperone GrpE
MTNTNESEHMASEADATAAANEAAEAAAPGADNVEGAGACEPLAEDGPDAPGPDPQKRIADLELALADQRDQALRSQAELENTRRRAQRDVENAHKFGLERFVNEMIPVLDSMELGLQAAGQEEAALQSLVEGTELTLKMLQSALGKFQVEPVEPVNGKFDPELHQAMSMQDAEGVESGNVIGVFQKGYTLNGRLVRPAMVIVAK